MGGIRTIPDCLVQDIEINDNTVLLLPGVDIWAKDQHRVIIEKASILLSIGGVVGAICGATIALASFGLLDNRLHTSNDLTFLEMFSLSYNGKNYYRNENSVSNNNLITAGSSGALM
ncbi:DJ-1/PfpI family protein [Lactococcus lactis]|uniref:DJ-1/PfpI family protein n=1 Tax=Lactococcus lactis TaxID=1358 RepID=UPI0024A7F9C5|nr:DJ-1/PfpI family protein [Lactococcus lactis]